MKIEKKWFSEIIDYKKKNENAISNIRNGLFRIVQVTGILFKW